MGAMNKNCCNPDPPNCETACDTVDPVTTATFTSPENGELTFTFPTTTLFDCSSFAETDCFFGDWALIFDQACEQDWPAVDPTDDKYVGLVLGGDFGPTLPECDCGSSYYGTTRHPFKFWYVQEQRSLRQRTWGRWGWKWYLAITPIGISGDLRVELSLRLVFEEVIGQSVGYRQRWKSMTAECETYITEPGGLTATNLVVTEIGDWIEREPISPLPEPPFCFWYLGDGLGVISCEETNSDVTDNCPDAYSSVDLGVSGNQGCDTGVIRSERVVFSANCNSGPSYPSYDQTNCVPGSTYVANNRTSISMGFYIWFTTINCSDLRDGPITLTCLSPPEDNLQIGSGLLLNPINFIIPCEFTATLDSPISASIPTTLTIEFA